MAVAPKVIVLRAAGTNCELETAWVWRRVGADARVAHLRELLDEPGLLENAQILTIPGGFSYGDDLGAGRIFGAQLERQLSDHLLRFVAGDKLVLGICNGFQVLVHAGLLPDPDFVRRPGERTCTVTANAIPGYQDRWVTLAASRTTPCVFLTPGRVYELPMAHGEGRVAFRTPGDLEAAQQQGLDALRFASSSSSVVGSAADEQAAVDRHFNVVRGDHGVYLGNPNGSDGDIAGLCDRTGRVFGLMPHPERFVEWTQHPAWTALPARPRGDGLEFFERAVSYFS
jgi:phosphoribosylformylglycinamidine synthase